MLRTGSLPAPLVKQTESELGPTLGADAISKTKWSFLLGIALVILIMVGVYRWSGWIAPSITARYFSSCPSDSTSRWTPCPPGTASGGCRSALAVSGFRLRARLGFSIPSSLPAREALPPRSDMALLIRAPEGLQPS